MKPVVRHTGTDDEMKEASTSRMHFFGLGLKRKLIISFTQLMIPSIGNDNESSARANSVFTV